MDVTIDTLNEELKNWIFLRGLLSDFDLEKKLEANSKINQIQNDIDALLLKQEEGNRGDLEMLDTMFEQAMQPIHNEYENIKSSGSEGVFAPDGTPSLLSIELNKIIKEPSFKNWFGDWVNAYKFGDVDKAEFNLSHVINKNGEPQVVWHGTGKEFSYFKFNKFPAAYFAENYEYSKWFANLQGDGKGYTIPFFLDIKRPLDLTKFGIDKVSPKTFWDEMFLQTGMNEAQLEVREIFLDKKMPPVETWVYIRNNPAMLQVLKNSNAFDGIIFYEHNPSVNPSQTKTYKTKAFIIFDPHNAKIADPKRGQILLSALRSFQLKMGGKIK